MTYEELWHRLTPIYDTSEAKAIVRWVLDVRFGLSMTDILCGKVTELSSNDQTELEKITARLEKAEPVQYVLGTADFCGRQFHVASGVLIPRPETAELCEWIIESEKRKKSSEKCRLLDIGTGSGCIAITLALEMPEAKVSAWDISDEALRIAQENAKFLGADISFEHQDILDSSLFTFHSSLFTIHSSLYNIIVSNPPYIQPSERDGMDKNVLDYEPETALFAPEDNPIIFYQRIGDYAIRSLMPGGLLYFELNPQTAEAVDNYLGSIGFQETEIRQDQFGKQRFLKAKKI
jgi:release factor glutamine methyltransferase